MENVIITKGLTKKYGRKTIIENIDLTIKKGEIYGLIGRNGAGKTTLMRVLLGMTDMTSGEIILFEDNNIKRGRLKTGSLIETPAFYEKMTAFENLKTKAKLIGLTNQNEKIDEALKTVGLYDVRNEKSMNFSLGMKQRLGIAMALLGNPELLILDEPINGLDPIAIADVRNALKRVNEEKGVTILISSHILGEMEKIATKYGFIVDSKLISELSSQEVEEKGIDLEEHFLGLVGGNDNA